MISREQLIDDYLDFVNNYLSVSLFAEHRGLTEGQARLLLDLAKMVFNSTHPDAQYRTKQNGPPCAGFRLST